jgi:hypothetical protein
VRVTVDDDRTPLPITRWRRCSRPCMAREPSREIVLRADRRLRYGDVKRFLKVIQGGRLPRRGAGRGAATTPLEHD